MAYGPTLRPEPTGLFCTALPLCDIWYLRKLSKMSNFYGCGNSNTTTLTNPRDIRKGVCFWHALTVASELLPVKFHVDWSNESPLYWQRVIHASRLHICYLILLLPLTSYLINVHHSVPLTSILVIQYTKPYTGTAADILLAFEQN